MEPSELGAGLDAELGVQVRERLVEQEDLRVAHHGSAERDALPLAARELARLPLQHGIQAERARDGLEPLARSRPAWCRRIRRPNARFSRTVMWG